MLRINHRCNRVEDVVKAKHGAEVDVMRDGCGNLIMSHDPIGRTINMPRLSEAINSVMLLDREFVMLINIKESGMLQWVHHLLRLAGMGGEHVQFWLTDVPGPEMEEALRLGLPVMYRCGTFDAQFPVMDIGLSSPHGVYIDSVRTQALFTFGDVPSRARFAVGLSPGAAPTILVDRTLRLGPDASEFQFEVNGWEPSYLLTKRWELV